MKGVHEYGEAEAASGLKGAKDSDALDIHVDAAFQAAVMANAIQNQGNICTTRHSLLHHNRISQAKHRISTSLSGRHTGSEIVFDAHGNVRLQLGVDLAIYPRTGEEIQHASKWLRITSRVTEGWANAFYQVLEALLCVFHLLPARRV